MKIVTAHPSESNIVRDIAEKTWPLTYGKTHTREQLRYMLDTFYSVDAIVDQMTSKKHQFLLAQSVSGPVGFISYESRYENTLNMKIHKLYVLPAFQGQRVGVQLLSKVIDISRETGDRALTLNVFKGNKSAIDFYQKLGFKIVSGVSIDIGSGFTMEDFVMKRDIERPF